MHVEITWKYLIKLAKKKIERNKIKNSQLEALIKVMEHNEKIGEPNPHELIKDK